MNIHSKKYILHATLIIGIVGIVLLCIFYPFFPGEYDGLAETLSAMAQLAIIGSVLFVPVGIAWLVYEMRKKAGKKRYAFTVTSLVVGSIVIFSAFLGAFMSHSIASGVLVAALWCYAVYTLTPKVRQLKKATSDDFSPLPFYLILIPTIVLTAQFTLASRAKELSRNHAIIQSTELIQEIENHRVAQGRYPDSLLAVNVDYHPSVVGIDQFYYAKSGDGYNVFFEHPRLFLPEFGTREFVMYNKLDKHVMPSHAYWILIWTPAELAERQGWYTNRDTSTPHWKYFWFD